MSSDFTTRVVLDIREPDDLFECYRRDPRVKSVLPVELRAGDVAIEQIYYERKTPEDFSAAVMDPNRNVFEQLERLEEVSDYPPILLIEGDMSDFDNLRHTNIKSQALRGAVASLAGRWGVQVLCCSTRQNLVDISLRMAEKMTTDESSSKILHSGSVVSKAPVTQRCFGCLDGVGPVMAEALYESFPTMRDACAASVEDLVEVDGVGSKTAQTIVESLGES